MWDWDSFWMAHAVLSERHRFEDAIVEKFLEHAVGTFRNFFEHQGANGAIPIMVKSSNTISSAVRMTPASRRIMPSRSSANSRRSSPRRPGTIMALAVFRQADALLRPLVRSLSIGLRAVRLGSGCGDRGGLRSDDVWTPGVSSANLLLNCLFHKDLQAAARSRLAGRSTRRR